MAVHLRDVCLCGPASVSTAMLLKCLYVIWFTDSRRRRLNKPQTPSFFSSLVQTLKAFLSSLNNSPCVSSLQGCGSLVSVSRSAGALSYRSTEDSSLPEILLGLIYNSATGQLSAEVIQGSHFKTTASDKPVSTYKKPPLC